MYKRQNDEVVKLIDFDAARENIAGEVEDTYLMGTKEFAAPEQYLKTGTVNLPFDATTDIYQLGVTLYELISGTKPYEEDSDRLKSIPEVSKALMKVIAKALAKEQSDRYQTARQFAAALHDALNRRPGLWERIFS